MNFGNNSFIFSPLYENYSVQLHHANPLAAANFSSWNITRLTNSRSGIRKCTSNGKAPIFAQSDFFPLAWKTIFSAFVSYSFHKHVPVRNESYIVCAFFDGNSSKHRSTKSFTRPRFRRGPRIQSINSLTSEHEFSSKCQRALKAPMATCPPKVHTLGPRAFEPDPEPARAVKWYTCRRWLRQIVTH